MLGIMVRNKGYVDPDNFFHIHPAPSPSNFMSLSPGTKYSYSECKKDYTVKHQSGSDTIACEKPENSTISQMPSRRICFFDPHRMLHGPPGRLSKKSAPRLLSTFTKDFAPHEKWDRLNRDEL